ncbi:PREDICTED: sterol 26-hydroxylase, mitochondrial-like [Nanorana parkeri]|uniref:sterol 26-hydroxylase, mitochondrial-like n=1 Tax=Nanorana parkeri TaxID=125878 RepID=UPI000854BB1F|nr:PREDICTED: sterol 26-hydroxylase, mitochondrial-like [Nanorana parkeri]
MSTVGLRSLSFRFLGARGHLSLESCVVGRVQRRAAVTEAAAAGVVAGDKKMKTFEDLPGPSLLTNLYWFFIRGYLFHSHELTIKYKKVYGPLFKMVISRYKMVNIMDPELLQVVLRQEGKYPMRTEVDLWKEHRDIRNLPYGPFTEQGHKWHTLRTVLNKRMLKPTEARAYTGSVNEVVTDLMERIQEIRRESASGNTVPDIANLLYNFAFEGISYILFEARSGCLNKNIPMETQKFVSSIAYMLKNSVYVTFMPLWTRRVFPYWERYLSGWDTIFAFTQKLIDKKMNEIQERLERGEEVQGEYLTYLLSSGKLTMDEVYGSVGELLMAGVDTTSNTLTWCLYHLAHDPELQQTLHEEVVSIAPLERIPTADDISRMPLLKATIKETLRLYPVVSSNGRMICEREVVIGDYLFPKKTLFVLNHYGISRDEDYFQNADKFLPQRWLRNGGMNHHPFSSIPFGYGIRACVGRRIAELEMHLALARIIRKFEIKYNPQGGKVKPMLRIVLVPSSPVNLEFLERATC